MRFPGKILFVAMLVCIVAAASEASAKCYALFNAEHPKKGSSLWRTDGTKKGTGLVKDPWNTGTYLYTDWPTFMTTLGKKVVFSAASPKSGRELWISNGKSKGTKLLKDIYKGASFSSVPNPWWSHVDSDERHFWELKNKLLFNATTNAQGTELWVTNGIPGGTRILKDFNAGAADGIYRVIAVADGFALVLVESDTAGTSLWRTDGTPGGTKYVADWTKATTRDYSDFGTRLGKNRVVFPMDTDLWVSDGTEAGTKMIKSFQVFQAHDEITHLAGFRNKSFVLFSAPSASHGFELWRTNGTTAGTYMVKNIMPYDESSYPANFFQYGKYIYFTAESDGRGRELWVTKGTAGSTKRISDIAKGTDDANPGNFVPIGKYLLFEASTTGYASGSKVHYVPKNKTKAKIVKGQGSSVYPRVLHKAGSRVIWSAGGKLRSVDKKLKMQTISTKAEIDSTVFDAAQACGK